MGTSVDKDFSHVPHGLLEFCKKKKYMYSLSK